MLHRSPSALFQARWALSGALLALAWLLLAPAALALDPHKQFQHYIQQRLGIEEGLPQLSVFAIAQDQHGYLWIGTQGGLARFDGARMTGFSEAPPANLPGPWVQALLGGRNGEMWIGTYKGLAVHSDDGFVTIPTAEPHAPLDIQALAFAPDNALLVAAQDGVYVKDRGQLKMRYAIDTGAFALLREVDGLRVGTVGGTLHYGTQKPRLTPLPESAAHARVQHLVRAEGVLWAGTSHGLYWMQDGNWQLFPSGDTLSDRPIEALFADSDGNLWVGQSDQLFRIVERKLVERAAGDDQALGVRAIFEDRERNLWLGTRWLGVIRLWDGWTRRFSTEAGLGDPLVWAVTEDADTPGALWVGAHGGVYHLQDGRFSTAISTAQLPQIDAYAVFSEPGRLWVGTRQGALVREQGRVWTPDWMTPLNDLQINSILRGRDKQLWFATSDGLYGWNGNSWRHFGRHEGLRDPHVRLIVERGSGELLIGTQAGIYALHDDRLHPLDTSAPALASADITALHELSSGELVAGTLGEKLWLRRHGRWTAFGSDRGIPANAPFFLHDDNQGQLWIAGMRGAYRTPVQSLLEAVGKPERRLQTEAIVSERGERNGGIRTPCCDGAGNARGAMIGATLWLPTREGVLALDSKDIRPNPVTPLPRVERVRVNEQWRIVGRDLDWKLPTGTRNLTFEFTAPSFQAPDAINLRYRLYGYDTAWQDVADPRQRTAIYTNLPPGDYSFQVLGSNNSGRWSALPAILKFSISPRFYQTTAFHVMAGAVILVALGMGYRFLLLLHRRQRSALERLVQERTEALATANTRLQDASYTDELTRLRNRRYLSTHIERDMALYRRQAFEQEGDIPGMVFVLVDIDHFKAINDSAGHHVGDVVLQQMAVLLQLQSRDSDYVVRWGGEEFVLVLRDIPRSHLTVVAERLRQAVARHRFELGQGRIGQLTCSLGLVEFPLIRDPEGILDWEQLMMLADRALYWVKRNGRDGWAAYRPSSITQVDDMIAALHGPPERMAQHANLHLVHSRLRNEPGAPSSPLL